MSAGVTPSHTVYFLSLLLPSGASVMFFLTPALISIYIITPIKSQIAAACQSQFLSKYSC